MRLALSIRCDTIGRMDIRSLIIERMEAMEITQAQLAEAAEMTRPRVNAYLRGHRDVYAETLAKMLDALNLEIRPAVKRRRKGK